MTAKSAQQLTLLSVLINVLAAPPASADQQTGVQTIEAEAAMEQAPQLPEATVGEIVVQARLPGSFSLRADERLTLILDGKPVGAVPWRGQVAAGQHRVALEGQRFTAPEQQVLVGNKQVVDVVLHAKPRMAELTIHARSGSIRLNNQLVAETLFSGKVPPGKYSVLVERPGFDSYQTSIELAPGQRLDLPVPTNYESSSEASYSTNPSDDAGTRRSDSSLYFDLVGLALFGLNSTHEWNNDCPELDDPRSGEPLEARCDTTKPLGGALGARLGVRLGGVIGIEGFAIGAGDWSKASISGLEIPGVPAYLQDMQIGRIGALLGGGLRLSTPTPGIRLDVGVGAGVALRRVYSNVSSLDGSSTGYAAPVLVGDISLVLGNTLSFGVLASAEFSETVTLKPDLSGIIGASETNSPASEALAELDGITVFQGPQWFVGPLIAVHFGN